MGILNKTRKILWAQSGNRCALCRQELVLSGTVTDDQSVVGDECHIVSREVNGPRHDSTYPKEKIDTIDNLILLCRVHHKQVDDQVETFTADILRQMKANHEKWVSEKLGQHEAKSVRIRRIKGNIPSLAGHLGSIAEVLNLVLGSYGGYFNHDEPRSVEEAEMVGGFLQDLRDLIDLWSDMEPVEQVKATYSLGEALKQLQDAGFMVFGARENQVFEGVSPQETWPMLHLVVVHRDNPGILVPGDSLDISEPG